MTGDTRSLVAIVAAAVVCKERIFAERLPHRTAHGFGWHGKVAVADLPGWMCKVLARDGGVVSTLHPSTMTKKAS